MKHLLQLACILAIILIGVTAQPAHANGGTVYTVQPGDTLLSIATHYGITVNQLLAANQLDWNVWVQAGQQLVIPSAAAPPVEQFGSRYPPAAGQPQTPFAAPPQSNQQYLLPPGSPLAQDFTGNPWPNVNFSQQPLTNYRQQETNYFDAPPASPPAPVESPSRFTSNGEKWIDVNLSTQTLTAFEGQTPVYSVTVSTGTSQYPTVVGTFNIYVKYKKARMRGGSGADAYDLPDVPYVMYFHRGYGVHGTYWHNNFGIPMSHGCVNLPIPDSEWLFNWAPIGTKVVTHY